MADGIEYELMRFRTADGEDTTVYVVRHPLGRTRVSVMCFPKPARLDHWCMQTGHREAMVAGFFVRDPYRPLGEVRVGGERVPHEPVVEPGGSARACVHIDGAVGRGGGRVPYGRGGGPPPPPQLGPGAGRRPCAGRPAPRLRGPVGVRRE